MRIAATRLVLILASVAPAALAAQWRVSAEPASAGRAPTVTAVAHEVSDSAAGDETPVSLVVRCVGRLLDAFLTTRDELDSDTNGDVRVRVQGDSARPRDQRWLATKSNTGAFIGTPDLRELVQRGVLRSRELRITAVTRRRGRVTYVFRVDGFLPALDALRDACPNDRAGALAVPGA